MRRPDRWEPLAGCLCTRCRLWRSADPRRARRLRRVVADQVAFGVLVVALSLLAVGVLL